MPQKSNIDYFSKIAEIFSIAGWPKTSQTPTIYIPSTVHTDYMWHTQLRVCVCVCSKISNHGLKAG